jgi:hypothetical protein
VQIAGTDEDAVDAFDRGNRLAGMSSSMMSPSATTASGPLTYDSGATCSIITRRAYPLSRLALDSSTSQRRASA